jgi:hypothetical protein
MLKRIVVTGILGGLILFAWSFIAHLPPIGTAGERTVSPAQGDAALIAMRRSMNERAIYILPGMDVASKDRSAWLAKFEAGPAAFVAFNPHPAEQAIGGAPYATFLLIELLSDIAAALLGAVLASCLSRRLGYWPRVLVVASIGLLATIDIDVSYWNWWAFPSSYLLAQFVDHVGGWFAAGLLLARLGEDR